VKYFDADSFQEIWATIARNKFRSVATGFGVFWGIFMLILLLAIGNKLKQGIMGQVGGFATNSVFFQPNRTTEAFEGFRKGRYWSFNSKDLELIRRKSRAVDLISPVLWNGGGEKNVVRGIKSGNYSFRGVYPAHFAIEQMHVLYGRTVNDMDIAERRKVCVIGKQVYETLFEPGEDPDGQVIRLNGIYFRVIGVVSPRSNVSVGGNVDESIFLPFSTQKVTFNRGDNFWFLCCTARPGLRASQVEEEVRAILYDAHSIAPSDRGAMWAMNLENQFRQMTGLFTGVNILMWIVGLGALFSGIIGISNIMLVTVRERMREIGVRRALGARPLNIVVQILSESLLLTFIAGLGGFMLGVGASLLVDKFMNVGGGGPAGVVVSTEPIVPFGLAMTAMAVLVASGVAAGLLPTWRALKIKAIDAIRDE